MLNRDIIETVAAKYVVTQEEDKLFSAPFRTPIKDRGCLRCGELLDIVGWKSARQLPNAKGNERKILRCVTRFAFQIRKETPAVAVHLLCYLKGVRVRMASAILAVVDPQRYTVMDRRAWATLQTLQKRGETRVSLPITKPSSDTHLNSPDIFSQYLRCCRELAARHKVDLRTLDRCLWVSDGKHPAEIAGVDDC